MRPFATLSHRSTLTRTSRSVDLLKASDDELERLTKACDTATFGRGNEDVLDKTYRTAGKLDAARFATTLVPERTELSRIVHDFMLEGKDNTREIVMELYKLNIYGRKLLRAVRA